MAPSSISVALFAILFLRISGAPTSSTTEKENYYDQRQNGTHNLQIEIDNVLIMHSPIPMQVLLAMLDNAPSDLATLQQTVEAAEKPSTTTEKGEPSDGSNVTSIIEEEDDFENAKIVNDGKKKSRPRLGLGAFLAPLLGFTKHLGAE